MLRTTNAEYLRGSRRKLWHRRLAGGSTGGTLVPHCAYGRRPRCGLCCVVMVLAMACVPTIVTGEGTTQTGRHFRVICDFDDEKIAAQALETAEAVWPVATRLFAVADRTPDEPGDIYLFRTVAAYEKVEAELTGGKFRRNLAFSHWDTRASYIVLQPDCSYRGLQKSGIPTMTRRLIAHEAAHLFRCTMIPNHRSHPDWLQDGAASWIEEQVLTADGRSSGAERDPDTSTMIVQALGLLEQNDLPSVNRILRDDIEDVQWSKRYAVR